MSNYMHGHYKLHELHARPLFSGERHFPNRLLLWACTSPLLRPPMLHSFTHTHTHTHTRTSPLRPPMLHPLTHTHTHTHKHFSLATASTAAPSYIHILLLYSLHCCTLLHTHTSPLHPPRLCPLTHTYIHTHNTHTHTHTHTQHTYTYFSSSTSSQDCTLLQTHTHTLLLYILQGCALLHTHTHTHTLVSAQLFSEINTMG